MGREFVIQRQRYLNLRLRFVLWGEACGLDICNRGDDGYIPQSIRSNILGTLGCIANLFEDGDELKHRYGLDSDMTLPEHPETSNPTDFSMLQVLTDQYNRFEQRIKRVKGHTGRLGTVRWAVSDRTRFTTLINHLKELVADLETLTMGIGSCQKQRQLVDREMKRIIDLSELQIIEEAGQDDDDPVSDAASARISTLRTQPSGTSNRSYHTVAYTGPTSILAAIEPVKSVPDISPDSQWQRILASLRTGKPSFQQNILVDESKCGDLLLWVKARHLLSELPEKFSRPRAKEIREVASAIVPWVDGWPIGGDLHDFISAIEGPLGTPYEGSVFYLRITLASRHPFRPPDCRFLTKIYHPNVNPSGQICSDLFNSGWSPAFTLTSILVAISGLLTSPNIEDPFVPEIATIYIQEPQTYEQYAFEHAAQHANPRLYPVVDADKGITFQMCNTSLEELICCLANRAVDDAFMLVTKYRCQSLSFSKERKMCLCPKTRKTEESLLTYQ
jgi:ubiquitin-conjugating enzyme E2 D/E